MRKNGTTIKTHLSEPLPPLTMEQKRDLDIALHSPITYDEDCPRQTPEQLKMFRRVNPKQKIANA